MMARQIAARGRLCGWRGVALVRAPGALWGFLMASTLRPARRLSPSW
jgi:hypothetical protein